MRACLNRVLRVVVPGKYPPLPCMHHGPSDSKSRAMSLDLGKCTGLPCTDDGRP